MLQNRITNDKTTYIIWLHMRHCSYKTVHLGCYIYAVPNVIYSSAKNSLC